MPRADRGRRRLPLAVVVCVGLLLPTALGAGLLLPTGLRAQDQAMASAPGAGEAEWLTYWSPLRPLADATRGFPGSGAALPGVLVTPAPRVGLLWSAGNPAGLASELEDSRTTFEAAAAAASGDYRRPLDPGEVESVGLSSVGWRPVGERGAVIGRVSVERLRFGGGAHTNRVDPYTATPFAIIDTAGADLGRTAAVIEGAGGIRLGPVGLALALAFSPAETRTVAAPVPKVNLSGRPAVSAGVVWDVAPALRVGAHGRWRRTTQRIQHLAVAAGSRIYEFAGFAEPIPLDLATHYNQYLEAEAMGVGLAAAGEVLGSSWVLYAEAGEHEELQGVRSRGGDVRDRWTASGLEAGLAVQRPLRLGAATLLVTGRALWSTAEGTAYQAERESDVFHADADAIRLNADLRMTHPAGWQGALTVGTTRASTFQQDSITRMHADLQSWSPTAAAEVGRSLGAGLAAAVGVAVAQYAPAGALPDPNELGTAARTWLVPGQMLMATPAWTYAGEATLRWTHPSGSAVWARTRYGSMTPDEGPFRLLLAPEGSRTAWRVALGVGLPGPR